jgi:predicted TIM-barrel fold metal-dependent hydrolase
MIDANVQVVPPRLPGSGPPAPLAGPPEAVAAELRRQMREAGVSHALAVGQLDGPEDDPLGVAGTLALARQVDGLAAIGVADPRRSDSDHLRRVEAALAAGTVKALKGYLGYLHYEPAHPAYRAYYELAERYRLPFVFHTGDAPSPRAKLRYARPVLVDEVAVDHPRVSFVLAHLGNPWLLEAAEVVHKNVNVWADVSGLAVGDADAFAAEERQEMLHEAQAQLRRAFRYAERPNRFVFGSDWPLAPVAVYRGWVAGAIPEMYHPQVFEENARVLFRV